MGSEAYEAAHLNPWPRLRQEFAQRSAAPESSQRSTPVRPHHLRCMDALLESTQDNRAREFSGIDEVGVAWVVDPFGTAEAASPHQTLESRINATLSDTRGWLPQNVLNSAVCEVMVRDPGNRHAPPLWLANGEIVVGKPGTQILVGNTLRGETLALAAGASLHFCGETPRSQRSRWRLVAGGFLALTVTLLALWSGLYTVAADDNVLSKFVIGLIGTSLFIVALQIDRWWVKELMVLLWARRIRRPQPAVARAPRPTAPDAEPARVPPRPESSGRDTKTPTRARGWRRVLQWLIWPLLFLYGWFLLTWLEHGQGAAGLVFLVALLVHLALLPFWLLFCRLSMRWRWWVTSGAAALSILSIVISQA